MTKKSLEIDPEEFDDLDDGAILDGITDELRLFVVPFLAAETDDKAIDAYNRYHDQKKLKKESQKNNILKFRNILSAMLKIAILGKQGKELPPDLAEKIPAVEKCIVDALSSEKPVVFWKGKDGTYGFEHPIILPNKEFERETYEWIRDIALSFYRQPGGVYEALQISFGYNVVGLCPNCGIFFSKKRKDQEYCSKNCKYALAMRRQYEKKKNKTNNS